MYNLIMNLGYNHDDIGSATLNTFPYYCEYDTIKSLFHYLREDCGSCYSEIKDLNILPASAVIYLIVYNENFEYKYCISLRNVREYQKKMLNDFGEDRFNKILKSYNQKRLV